MYIPQQTVDLIFSTAKIDEVVQDFLPLKKNGQNLTACCPFHNERTPSFIVSTNKGIYKCFGCGKGGNVVNFVMEHEKFSYPEALKYLAKKYGITVEEKEETTEEKKNKEKREILYLIHEYATEFFTKSLIENDEGKKIGLSYFTERGLNMSTILDFKLGYNPTLTSLYEYLKTKGIKDEELISSGLFVKINNNFIDKFSGRVIYPFFNIAQKIIGFGGRTLLNEKDIPKYVNSPETEIYIKGNNLFGLNKTKDHIVKQNEVYLVEGYMDLLSLYQKNIKNTAASSGTALTENQLYLIKRFTNNLTFFLDGDEAGKKATEKGIDLALKQNFNVRVIEVDPKDDPDTLAKRSTPEELLEYLSKNKIDFLDFKINKNKEDLNDPFKKTEFINELLTTISYINNQILREELLNKLAEKLKINIDKLYSNLSTIRGERIINERKEVNKIEQVKIEPEKQIQEYKFDELQEKLYVAEKELIIYLIYYSNEILKIKDNAHKEIIHEISVFDLIKSELEADEIEFKNNNLKLIYDEIKNKIYANEKIYIDYFIRHQNQEISSLIIDIITKKERNTPKGKGWEKLGYEKFDELKDLQKDIIKSISAYKGIYIDLEIEKILEKNNINPEKMELINEDIKEELIHLIKIKNNISKSMERVILSRTESEKKRFK